MFFAGARDRVVMLQKRHGLLERVGGGSSSAFLFAYTGLDLPRSLGTARCTTKGIRHENTGQGLEEQENLQVLARFLQPYSYSISSFPSAPQG